MTEQIIYDTEFQRIELTPGYTTRIVLTDKATGARGTGSAKLGCGDEYDEQFGIRLAHARAAARMNKRLVEKLVRSTELDHTK